MTEITNLIKEKLNEIENKENVRILYACESGSRAWGFASPDSDYDVRFIYVRDEQDYLSLNEKRDVIEWELNEKFDISGWDLKKALKLAHNSNTAFFEWLKSPIVYKISPDWEKIINDFSFSYYFNTKKAVHHYLSIANKHIKKYFEKEKTLVNQKKYFYIIRSLLCAKFIIYASKNNEQFKIPPIQIEKLLPFVENEKVLAIIQDLIEKKKETSKNLLGMRILELDKWIFDTFELVTNEVQKLNDYFSNDWTGLNNIFFNFVKNFSNANKKLVHAFKTLDCNLLAQAVKEGASINYFSNYDITSSSLYGEMLSEYMWNAENCQKYIKNYPKRLVELYKLSENGDLSSEQEKEYTLLRKSVDYTVLENQVIKFLDMAIDFGLDINRMNETSDRAMEHSAFLACIDASLPILKFLVSKGVDYKYKNNGSESVKEFLNTEIVLAEIEADGDENDDYIKECKEKIDFLCSLEK